MDSSSLDKGPSRFTIGRVDERRDWRCPSGLCPGRTRINPKKTTKYIVIILI